MAPAQSPPNPAPTMQMSTSRGSVWFGGDWFVPPLVSSILVPDTPTTLLPLSTEDPGFGRTLPFLHLLREVLNASTENESTTKTKSGKQMLLRRFILLVGRSVVAIIYFLNTLRCILSTTQTYFISCESLEAIKM